MPVRYDADHPCPRCGAEWKVLLLFPPATKKYRAGENDYWVASDSGWCSDPRCSITPTEIAAYREERRRNGWDPSPPDQE